MNSRIAKRFIFPALILAFTLCCAGCDDEPSYDYTWFVDWSASVSPDRQADQQTQWLSMREKQIARLKCGDRIRIFAVSNQTSNSAPIYDQEIPPLGDTYEEELKCRQKLKQVREELKQKFQEAFSPQQRASESDYLSAIDRLKPDGTRHQRVYFAGDLLHSNAELDLEKVRLTQSNIADLLNPVVAKHGWREGRLKGAKVYCILNSLSIIDAKPLNDRQLLHRFWRTAFESLGAELVHFDSSVVSDEKDEEER